MDSAKNQMVTYWLIPAEPARSYFVSAIHDLAAKFDAPAFEPHLTIYATTLADENPAEILERVTAGFAAAHLMIAGINYSDEFTKTLFVQFQPCAAVTRLSADFRQASIVKEEHEVNPHVSLIYKILPAETKAALANSVTVPFPEVRFDAAKAVISPANIQSREDVEAWRVVANQKLRE